MKKLLFILILSLFLFNSCKDPCDDCLCIFGYCYDGTCYCDQGYRGSSCDIQITPTIIKITRVDVINFPSGSYDIGSNSDILITIYHGSSLIYQHDHYFPNANPGSTYTFEFSNPVNITNPLDRYSLVLYDYDETDANDWIGGVEFSPYYETNGFPETQIVTYGDFTFKVYYSYEW